MHLNAQLRGVLAIWIDASIIPFVRMSLSRILPPCCADSCTETQLFWGLEAAKQRRCWAFD